MIALAALVRLPVSVVTAIGVVMIAGHNLLDPIRWTHPLWMILHRQGFALNTPETAIFVAYPLIPWIGVTAAGFGLGQIYRWESERRRSFLLRLGFALTIGFVIIRFVNVYGDPFRWAAKPTAMLTVIAFLNTTKYPPSLVFLLMTLGPALIFLGLMERGIPRWLRPSLVIGKVPLFYFFLHFTFIHALAATVCFAIYGSPHWMFESPNLGNYPFTAPPGWGFSLPVIYLTWAFVVLAMYVPCRWFASLKQQQKHWSLSYF
jgi:uncharacterized membrane protein